MARNVWRNDCWPSDRDSLWATGRRPGFPQKTGLVKCSLLWVLVAEEDVLPLWCAVESCYQTLGWWVHGL